MLPPFEGRVISGIVFIGGRDETDVLVLGYDVYPLGGQNCLRHLS
jgi:hypothetical protein